MDKELFDNYLTHIHMIHSAVKRVKAKLNMLEDDVEKLKVAIAREEKVNPLPDRWKELERNHK